MLWLELAAVASAFFATVVAFVATQEEVGAWFVGCVQLAQGWQAKTNHTAVAPDPKSWSGFASGKRR
jgi:hypothetical protein